MAKKCHREGCGKPAAENWIYCSLKCQEVDSAARKAAKEKRESAAFAASVAEDVRRTISSGKGLVAEGEAVGFPPESRMAVTPDGRRGGAPADSSDRNGTSWLDENGRPPRYPYKGPPGD